MTRENVMSSFTPLKTAFVSTIFAINALVNPAHSAPTEEIRDKPTCDLDFLVIDTLKDSSFLPTGIKASSDKWEMEIYTNSKTGRWRLMGVSKDPKIAPPDEVCQLAWGGTPYTQTSWYQQNFVSPATKPATKVLIDKTQPKPSVN